MRGAAHAGFAGLLVLSDAPLDAVAGAHAESATVEEWALALAAAGIPHRVVAVPGGWAIGVAAADQTQARAIVAEADAERQRRRAGIASDELDGGSIRGALVMVAALAVAYLLTAGPGAVWALHAGAADARSILAGQTWRAVTALTLHADAAHLVSNLVSGGVVAAALCRTLGGGLTALLLVAAGTGGNWLNAVLRGPGHVSIGASTAVLGGIGIVTGLACVRSWRLGTGFARAWVPLAAGFALLALLGATEDARVDVGAHLLGFLVGGVLGGITGLGLRRAPGPAAQRALGALAGLVVAGAWLLALRNA
ncbi:MAG: rhomboid family intramembrane serine protease [bacterium]|nr:rhomboid family intramembrane serine protease [bacterium]